VAFFEKDKNLSLAPVALNRSSLYGYDGEWGHKLDFRDSDDAEAPSDEDLSEMSIEDEESITVRLVLGWMIRTYVTCSHEIP
jgi:hypothetical protein